MRDYVRERADALLENPKPTEAEKVPEAPDSKTAQSSPVTAGWRSRVKYFSQYDDRWKDELMGDGKIKDYGCLLSSLAMMLSPDFSEMDPKVLNLYLRSNRGYTNGNMVVFEKINAYPGSRFRYHARESFDLEKLKRYMDDDYGVILGFPGNAHWVFTVSYRNGGTKIEDYAYNDPGWNGGAEKFFSSSQVPVSMRVFRRLSE